MAGGYGIRPYGDAVELSCIVGGAFYMLLNMYVFPHQSDIRPGLGLGAVGMGE